jgi:hypothetical protein
VRSGGSQILRHLRMVSRSGSMLVALVAMIWLATACGGEPTKSVVQLLEYDGSGQSGTATLTRINDRTEVVLKVEPGPPEDDPQPVHIHFGNCGPNLGELRFRLTDVIDGKSTSVIDITLAELENDNSIINLHKSYENKSVFTACGDIGPQ